MEITRQHLLSLVEAIAATQKHPDPKGYTAEVEAAWDALVATAPAEAPAAPAEPEAAPGPTAEPGAPE